MHLSFLGIIAFAFNMSLICNIYSISAQTDNQSTTDPQVNQTILDSMNSIINKTANTSSLSDATGYMINVTIAGNNNSLIGDNPTIDNLVNSLINTLRNTNATSIAASYVINITSLGQQGNSTQGSNSSAIG